MAATNVARLYFTVINDVINGVKEHFIDEGLDEHCLLELKSLWEKKLMESKAIDAADVVRPMAGGLPHQLTLQQTAAGGAGIPTLLQYRGAGAGTQLVRLQGDAGTKTVTILPNKGGMTISLPQGINPSNIQSIMSGAASTAALALPPEITNQWLQSNGQPVQFQQLAAGANKQQFLAAAQAPGGATTQLTSGGKQFTLVRVPGPAASAAQQAAGTAPKYTIFKMPPSAQQQPGVQPNITFVRMPANQAQPQMAAGQPQFTLAAPAQQPPPSSQQGQQHFSVDGHGAETSEDDDEDDYNDDDDKDGDDDDQGDDDLDGNGEEEDPLNSNDDVSEDGDSHDIFDIDNVVVCQYDKISRSRNRWKFQFKDGIMNLEGKDYVFQKALGDAEW